MLNLTSLLFIVLLSSTYYVENGSAIESIECEFCKKLFAYVYNLLDEDRTIKSIEGALDSVCDQIFSGSQVATCEDYVNKYTPMIVDLIVKTTEPDEACTLLQLCNSSDESKSLFKLISDKLIKSRANNNANRCNECLADVDSLRTDFILARKEHIPKLQQCCSQFPTPDGLCDSYINTINPIYDTLESKLVPEEACSTFAVCPAATATNNDNDKKSTVDKVEPDCSLCKQVFRLVDKVINRQAKIDIEIAFDRVCNIIIPSGSRKACRNLVDKYTTQLINFISQHTDPNVACRIIGMCKDDQDVEDNLMSLTSKLNLISMPMISEDCDNCNKSVGWAAVTINGYATSLNGMMENTCLDYTHDYDFCKGYMANQFNSETNELISKTSSDYFCINIFGLCPTEKRIY